MSVASDLPKMRPSTRIVCWLGRRKEFRLWRAFFRGPTSSPPDKQRRAPTHREHTVLVYVMQQELCASVVDELVKRDPKQVECVSLLVIGAASHTTRIMSVASRCLGANETT